ncbi:MAG: hypothetical protein WHV67_04065 [Thermoanaerobaculia bacterium]
MSWENYVKLIEDSCGKEKDFIILLNSDLREEAITKIKEKMKIERNISNIMLQGKIFDKEITLFCHGKVILKGFKNKRDLEYFLNQIFS